MHQTGFEPQTLSTTTNILTLAATFHFLGFCINWTHTYIYALLGLLMISHGTLDC